MATQVTGRKRIPNREKLTAEEDALSQIAREAEARLAAKRAARAEAREIRMKELERQQKEISDDEERLSVGSRGSLRGNYSELCSSTSCLPSSRLQNGRVEERADFLEKGSRTASTLSASTLASLGGGLSRRGSCDTSISVDTEASIREMKDSLTEAEEKYRRAMVSNAQLDNEKSTLMYHVDTLRETLLELEELLYETRREYDEKSKEYERERHAHVVLQLQFSDMKDTLMQTQELLKKHGVVLGPEVATNGEAGNNDTDSESASRVVHNPHAPSVSGDSMLERIPEDQDLGIDRQHKGDVVNNESRKGNALHDKVDLAKQLHPEEEGGTSEPLIKERGGALEPLTEEEGGALEPLIKERGRALEPLTEEEGGALEPFTEEEGGALEPLIEEEGGALEPLIKDEITTLLNDSRKETLGAQQDDSQPAEAHHLLETTTNRQKKLGNKRPFKITKMPEVIENGQDLVKALTIPDTSSSSRGTRPWPLRGENEPGCETPGAWGGPLGTPVEERGIVSFLDSCQEAGTLDMEEVTAEHADNPSNERRKSTDPAGHRGKNSGNSRMNNTHECCVS